MTPPPELKLTEGGASGLVVRNVAKSYKGRPVLRDVSLSLRRGEVAALLGPNGAGKTTCFYAVAGLVPPDRGTVMVDGQDVTWLPMYRRAKLGIGYLPQEASIFRGMTVADNIRAILEITVPDAEKRAEMLDELLGEFVDIALVVPQFEWSTASESMLRGPLEPGENLSGPVSRIGEPGFIADRRRRLRQGVDPRGRAEDPPELPAAGEEAWREQVSRRRLYPGRHGAGRPGLPAAGRRRLPAGARLTARIRAALPTMRGSST